VHLVGKGVLRFHAVYWPAMLLSAGEPLPTDIVVHDYLTAGGRKISKSGDITVDPAELAGRYGTDAVRWWLLREVPRKGDADFTEARLVARADDELANGFGSLAPSRRRPRPSTRHWGTRTSAAPQRPSGTLPTRPTGTSTMCSPGGQRVITATRSWPCLSAPAAR
jgi:hypothetical protein